MSEFITITGMKPEGEPAGVTGDAGEIGRRLIFAVFDYDDEAAEWSPVKGGSDPEAEAAVCAMFTRNIPGAPMFRSQYSKEYTTFKYGLSRRAVEELGLEKARAVLCQTAIDELQPWADKANIAVWRVWPRITDCDGGLALYMRLHLMTSKAFAALVPAD